MKPHTLWSLLLLSCAPAKPSPAPDPAPAEAPTVMITVPSAIATTSAVSEPEPAPAPKPTAPDELVGKLSLTKGAQPVLQGRILSAEDMVSHLGDDWRDLVGHRLRARGEKHVYVCDPRAQCLRGGEIPTLRNIVSVDVCKSCEFTKRPRKVVACPPTEDEVDACVASCKEVSDRCDAGAKGDRGRLRQCGSRFVGCRSSCQKSGESCP